MPPDRIRELPMRFKAIACQKLSRDPAQPLSRARDDGYAHCASLLINQYLSGACLL